MVMQHRQVFFSNKSSPSGLFLFLERNRLPLSKHALHTNDYTKSTQGITHVDTDANLIRANFGKRQ
jgi:hypothetical protein